MWDEYGTTLKGLEVHHGVDREHYCDFIHAIEEHHLPPPNPALTAWLGRVPHPCYIFTNARADWAVRGLKAMGLESILPRPGAQGNREGTVPGSGLADGDPPGQGLRLHGMFDIAFMDWQGKPHPESYAKVEAFLRGRHGDDIQIHCADDRRDNLETARDRGWVTIWIAPHDAPAVPPGTFDRMVPSLTGLDPESLAPA
jgi:FMN phosphatase YigB (HAD superfamily)